MTKLEHVASAIGAALRDGKQLDGAARAALEAIKVPTDKMVEVGKIEFEFDGMKEAFNAMIQAALDEQPPSAA